MMNQTGLIYIADDEKEIRELIQKFLEEAGHKVEVFENGEVLLKRFKEKNSDLVILDVMMPGKDGFVICRELRELSNVPIVLLTAKDTDTDYIIGFTSGCDDYFAKPFSPIKLMMRINAILKRAKMENSQGEEGLVYGNLVMDISAKKCEIEGKEVRLTRMEWDLIYYMLERKAEAVSREELLDAIWGYSAEVETRVTDDTVKRLRKKLSLAGSNVMIETVWGFGFRLEIKEE